MAMNVSSIIEPLPMAKQTSAYSEEEASTACDDATSVSSRSESLGARGNVMAETESITSQDDTAPMKISPSIALDSQPRKCHDIGLSQIRWDSLAHSSEYRTSISVRGLPRQVCEVQAFESLLVANGLREHVQKFRILPLKAGLRAGVALVKMNNVEDVPKVAKFFHGWTWDSRLPPVAVSFTREEGLTAPVGKSTLKDSEPRRLTGLLSQSRSGGSLPEAPLRALDFPVAPALSKKHFVDAPPGLSRPVDFPPGLSPPGL
mmetsp:Transcript_20813/g.48259  ORF Transcript_20813/g.48259 Transcript_20813/m.48259 type:complete len:261 (+) Transcript_20813:89-871(+)